MPHLSTLVHSTSRLMHWATRWRHSALFVASSSGSSHVVPISFRSCLTMSIQFYVGRPSFLLYPLSSHSIASRGILESSIQHGWAKNWPGFCTTSQLALSRAEPINAPLFVLHKRNTTTDFHDTITWRMFTEDESLILLDTETSVSTVGTIPSSADENHSQCLTEAGE